MFQFLLTSDRRSVAKNNLAREAGFTITEVLVSISLLALLGLGVTNSAISSLRFSKYMEVHHVASSLAISKMEEIGALNTVDIDTGLSATENSVVWPGLTFAFTRTTAVTMNADNSRSVDVTVTSNDAPIPASVTFTSTYALWE